MKTIITYGTFDLFHIGHLKLIKRLNQLGERLIIAVSSDEFNQLKGKKTIIPFEQRAEIVESIKGVDLVIKEDSWDQKVGDIKKYNVDLFVMGDDWEGKFDELKSCTEVLYLPRTKGVSSTELKSTIKDALLRRDDLERAFSILEQIKRDLD